MLGRRRQEIRESSGDLSGRNVYRKRDDLRRSEKFFPKDYWSKKKEEGKSKESKDFRSDKKSKEKDKELPPNLPQEKWRKNEKGRTMKRKCRFCGKWHMDYDCPFRPAAYNIVSMSMDQMGSSGDDEISDRDSPSSQDSSSESEEGDRRWKPEKSSNMIYHNVYTNISPGKPEQITIPRASQYRIEEMPMAFSVGTGVSYLSAQPCPVKAWVGIQPHPNQPLQNGVTDTGASCIIEESLVPPNYPIMASPLKPVFQSIEKGQTPAKGYVVLPVHLPNAAAMSGDDRHVRVDKIWMEFQVVDSCPAGFLIGMDALKAYKWSIDLPAMTITLKGYDPPIRIPITDTQKNTQKIDPRVFAAEPINIQPFHELWVPVRFTPPDSHSDLMVTPVRHANLAEGTYATCSYAIMSKDTDHLLMVNPTERPFRIQKDEVVGMFEPVVANTPFAYFSSTAVANLS